MKTNHIHITVSSDDLICPKCNAPEGRERTQEEWDSLDEQTKKHFGNDRLRATYFIIRANKVYDEHGGWSNCTDCGCWFTESGKIAE